ncbi:MAG TPA: DUF6790 family protein [Opitutaceae bacterium]|jgi:hypothetical protein|nr:DUF6790 family protein [Opitutaceae bacterium]
MAALIRFALSNFTLTLLLAGFISAGIALALKPKPLAQGAVSEALLAHFLLFSIGVSYFYNFVVHVFFAETAARFIGWANSPFQYEVGFASLGFALVGLLAFRRDASLRLAALLGPTAFLWGAAGGHIVQMVTEHNFAPGNAGVIFWSDIVLPLIGWALFAAAYRRNQPLSAIDTALT